MVDVARLQVEVDSTKVRKAESDLGGFSRGSKKAERSAKGFANQSQRTAKAVSSMNRSVNLLKGGLAALTAAFSLNAIRQFTMSAINSADQIGKLSATAGVSAESLQELRFAFGQLAGTTDGDVDAALRRFNRRLGLAEQGTGAAKDTFEELGISITNAAGDLRSGDAVLNELLNRLSQIENDSRRAAFASQAFGEDAGPRLAAALGEGEQAVESMRQEARDLGIVLGGDAIESAERFSDQMDILNKTLMVNFQEGLLTSLAGDAGSFADAISDPEFQKGIETLGSFIGDSLKFMVDNADIIIKTGQALALIGLSAKLGGAVGGGRGAAIGGGVGAAIFALSEAISQATSTADEITQEANNTGTAATGGTQQPMLIEGPEQLPMLDLTEGIEEANRQLEKAEKKTEIWEDSLKAVKDVLEDDLSDSITDVIMQVDSLSDAFKSLATQIARTLIQRQIADPLAESITGGIGDILSGGFSSIGGGAPPSVRGIGPTGSGSGFFSSLASFIPGFANGGNVFGSEPAIVGERGPELFVPGQDGRIVPNHEMGGGGDVTVNIINQGGEKLQAEQQQTRRGPNGEQTIDVMVKSSMERLDSQGQLDGIFRRHGAKRQGQF